MRMNQTLAMTILALCVILPSCEKAPRNGKRIKSKKAHAKRHRWDEASRVIVNPSITSAYLERVTGSPLPDDYADLKHTFYSEAGHSLERITFRMRSGSKQYLKRVGTSLKRQYWPPPEHAGCTLSLNKGADPTELPNDGPASYWDETTFDDDGRYHFGFYLGESEFMQLTIDTRSGELRFWRQTD